jgi:hypothetical protein
MVERKLRKRMCKTSINIFVMALRMSMTKRAEGDSRHRQMMKTCSLCAMLREVTDERIIEEISAWVGISSWSVHSILHKQLNMYCMNEKATRALTEGSRNDFKECFQKLCQCWHRSLPLPTGTTFKEMLCVQIWVHLFLCNEPIPGTFWNYLYF